MKNAPNMSYSHKGHVVCHVLVGSKWITGINSHEHTSPAWTKVLRGEYTLATRHAEAHAIQQAQKLSEKIKKVYVFRFTKRGVLTMAKPCQYCMMLLEDAGVKPRDVFYSDWNGNICRLNHD